LTRIMLAVALLTGCEFAMVAVGDVTVPDYMTTPGQVFDWVANYIEYTPDVVGYDDWQLPDQTMDRRTGDCEDHVILALYLLREIGYEGTMEIGESRSGSAHAWATVDGVHWDAVAGHVIQELPEMYPNLRFGYDLDTALLIAQWAR
jgi:hypothetical protein